jgi:hypothetical protein
VTTTIKVISHNSPALVEVYDNGEKTSETIVRVADGEVPFHCTTTRSLRIVDLETGDARLDDDKEFL